LRSDGPPTYERALRGSVVDAVEPRIRELLRAWPTMLAERIGWERSVRVLRDRVAELRRAGPRRELDARGVPGGLPAA